MNRNRGPAPGTGPGATTAARVRLVPKADRHLSQQEIERQLRRELAGLSGVTAYPSVGGPGGEGKQVQIQVRGTDLGPIQAAAEQILAEVKKVPGATDVDLSTKGQKPEIEVTLNRGLAGTLNLTAGQISQSLRPAFAGIKAGDWVDPLGKTRDVTVRLAPAARDRPVDLERLPLVVGGAGNSTAGTAAGGSPAAAGPTTIPLGQVATITRTLGPNEIDHLDRDVVITVGANVQGRSLSEVSRAVNARVAKVKLAPGVSISQGVIPTVYEIFDGWRERLGARFRRHGRHGHAGPEGAPEPVRS